MATPREALFVALFDKLAALIDPTDPTSVLVTASRVLVSWDDCPASQCPAAYLLAVGETRAVRRGYPALVTIRARIIVYCKNNQGRDTIPSTQLNAVISAIEDALHRTPLDGPLPGALFPQNPDLTFGTTLGGLCYSCSIDADVEIYDGFQGADAVAVIPVLMLTSDSVSP